MLPEPDRDSRPTADIDAHAAEMARLGQERDALRAWLVGQAPVPHGDLSPAVLRRKRQWCRVQRAQAAQQRKRGEEGA